MTQLKNRSSNNFDLKSEVGGNLTGAEHLRQDSLGPEESLEDDSRPIIFADLIEPNSNSFSQKVDLDEEADPLDETDNQLTDDQSDLVENQSEETENSQKTKTAKTLPGNPSTRTRVAKALGKDEEILPFQEIFRRLNGDGYPQIKEPTARACLCRMVAEEEAYWIDKGLYSKSRRPDDYESQPSTKDIITIVLSKSEESLLSQEIWERANKIVKDELSKDAIRGCLRNMKAREEVFLVDSRYLLADDNLDPELLLSTSDRIDLVLTEDGGYLPPQEIHARVNQSSSRQISINSIRHYLLKMRDNNEIFQSKQGSYSKTRPALGHEVECQDLIEEAFDEAGGFLSLQELYKRVNRDEPGLFAKGTIRSRVGRMKDEGLLFPLGRGDYSTEPVENCELKSPAEFRIDEALIDAKRTLSFQELHQKVSADGRKLMPILALRKHLERMLEMGAIVEPEPEHYSKIRFSKVDYESQIPVETVADEVLSKAGRPLLLDETHQAVNNQLKLEVSRRSLREYLGIMIRTGQVVRDGPLYSKPEFVNNQPQQSLNEAIWRRRFKL